MSLVAVHSHDLGAYFVRNGYIWLLHIWLWERDCQLAPVAFLHGFDDSIGEDFCRCGRKREDQWVCVFLVS